MVNLKESIISEIKDLAIKCGVEKVILFGSRARGDNKERSDIDLAIEEAMRRYLPLRPRRRYRLCSCLTLWIWAD